MLPNILDLSQEKGFPETSLPIVQIFFDNSRFMPYLGFRTQPSGISQHLRRTGHAPVGWRSINGAFPKGKGRTHLIQEQSHPLGGDIQIDLEISERDDEFEVGEVNGHLAAIMEEFDLSFIKGDGLTGGIMGLQARVQGTENDFANSTAQDGAALDLDKLGDAKDQTVNPTAWIATQSLARKLAKKLENSSAFERGEDRFGRKVMFYDGLPIIAVDGPERINQILGYDEPAIGGDSGSPATTSIYCVSFEDNGVTAFWRKPPSMRVVAEEMEGQPAKLHRSDVTIGIEIKHPKAISRVHSIRDADIA